MSGSLTVLDWSSWQEYLVGALFPDAIRLKLQPFDAARALLEHVDIVRRVAAPSRHVLLHVDLSDPRRFLVGRARLEAALRARRMRLLNAHAPDVSKRNIQAVCRRAFLPSVAASRDGDASELVIVKTNANAGGEREARLDRATQVGLGIASKPVPIGGPKDYRVVPRGRVPKRWWSHPGLAIERFVTNPRGRMFRAYVLGSSVVISEARVRGRIKRITSASARKDWLLRRARGRLAGVNRLPPRVVVVVGRFLSAYALDYGAADFVEDEAGEIYPVDVTTTPFWGEVEEHRVLRHLRRGL